MTLARWRLLGEAVAALGLATLAVRLLPFRRAVTAGGLRLGQPRTADIPEIRWSIETASRRLPWRSVCFPKGLALQAMLRRRGVDARLHYGVGTGDDGALEAHVWVAAGDDIVIGGEQSGRFRSVAAYP